MAAWLRIRPLLWTIWLAYLLQLGLSIAVLGLSTTEAWKLKHELDCHAMPKLQFNIASAVLSVVILVTLIILDRPGFGTVIHGHRFVIDLWSRIASNFILLALWLAVAVGSVYNCEELCKKECPTDGKLNYAGMFCNCKKIKLGNTIGSSDFDLKQGLAFIIACLFVVLLTLSILTRWAEGVAEPPSAYHKRNTSLAPINLYASKKGKGKESPVRQR